jgi:hypothetical protein
VQELSFYRPAPFRTPAERAWIRWTWWAPRGIRRGESLVGGMREGDQGRQEQPIFPKASQAFSTDWGSPANCCASLIFVWKSSYHFQLEGCTLKMKLYSVSISLPGSGQSPLDNNHHMFTMGGS